MDIPQISRGDYDSVHYPGADEDDLMMFQMDAWHRVAEFLGPVIGEDYGGSGGFIHDPHADGVWFEGSYNELQVKLFLPWEV